MYGVFVCVSDSRGAAEARAGLVYWAAGIGTEDAKIFHQTKQVFLIHTHTYIHITNSLLDSLNSSVCVCEIEEEACRALKTLRSSKAPMVKKRQVMRAVSGDYRKKMEQERERQFKLIHSGERRNVQTLSLFVRQTGLSHLLR